MYRKKFKLISRIRQVLIELMWQIPVSKRTEEALYKVYNIYTALKYVQEEND
jgi:hypothetical protein